MRIKWLPPLKLQGKKIETCGECPNLTAEYRSYCVLTNKSLHEESESNIPSWCPLEDYTNTDVPKIHIPVDNFKRLLAMAWYHHRTEEEIESLEPIDALVFKDESEAIAYEDEYNKKAKVQQEKEDQELDYE